MKSLVSVVLFMAVASVSGCALTTDRVALEYSPQKGVSPIAGARAITVNVQVADQRQDKSKISSKKNGFGMEMAPILAAEDVTITVRRAIEQELRSRGFELGADDSLIKIAADLVRFYNDHKVGFFAGDAVADLHMSVVVKSRKNELLWSKQVIAQGIEANTQLMGGDNAKRALDKALENGMKQLFEDQAFLSALMTASAPKAALQ
jgi:uncharacterized lipoprotein